MSSKVILGLWAIVYLFGGNPGGDGGRSFVYFYIYILHFGGVSACRLTG